MAIIQTLKDQANNIVYPQTHINAVINGNGEDLSTLLSHKVSTNEVGQYLPPATTSSLGGVIADNVTIKVNANGVISSVIGMNMQVVQTLPTHAISTTTIYLVPNQKAGQNIYDEYVYIGNKWERIGSSDVDLTNYAKKDELPQNLSDLNNNIAIEGYDKDSQETGLLGLKRNSESNWNLLYNNVAEGQIAILNDLPTKLSDLTNDTGFITKSTSALENYTLSNQLSVVATSGSYNDLNNKPTFATVATSGNYNDLSNKPSIPDINTLMLKTNPTYTGTLSGEIGTFSGKVTVNASVTPMASQVRNITCSTSEPTSADGQNGDLWIVYEEA